MNNHKSVSTTGKNTTSCTSGSSNANPNMCNEHQKKIKAYCASDRALICIDCIILSDYHKNHEIIAIEKAFRKESKSMTDYVEKAKTMKDKLLNYKYSIES